MAIRRSRLMRLNAKVSSERTSRTVSKSGNEYIEIELNRHNENVAVISFTSRTLLIDYYEDGRRKEIEIYLEQI